MGVIPKVTEPSPAFIHVDVDDLWAIAECYGQQVATEWAHHVSTDALPRFAQLFREGNVAATFFLVGRDLESPAYVELVRSLMRDGHKVANHSYSHSLRFRAMQAAEVQNEIGKTHQLALDNLGVELQGFRAPGYAWSRTLLEVLQANGYKYDASLMPGPYGGVFRWMDRRIQNRYAEQVGGGVAGDGKTQYPLFSDTWNSLYPAPDTSTGILELPSATSGLLRLPFQAGVCMRLGWPYFRSCFEPYRWNRALPFVFLFHAADLADLSAVPYKLFRESSFFNMPVSDRVKLARRFLQTIKMNRPVITTEEWLEAPAGSAPDNP